jgi:hypothetical protein
MTIKLGALCVFCGANPGARPEYAAAGEALGRLLAERGIDLVYGGGSIGMMGSVARAALAAGGRVIGVIPERSSARNWRKRDSPSFMWSARCTSARR